MTRLARFSASLSHNSTAIDAASSYTTIGSVPYGRISVMTVVNTSDVDIRVSMNGTDDNFLIPAGSIRVFNWNSEGFFMDGTTDPKFKKVTGTPTAGGLLEFEFIHA